MTFTNMQLSKLLQIVIVCVLFFVPTQAQATVIEFNNDGTTTVYAAVDYLSQTRRLKTFSPPVLPKQKLAHQAIIEQISKKYNVDKDLISAVILVESAYKLDAISPKGAQGLMQLMPQTAARFKVKDAFNAEQNIEGGTKYLKFLSNLFEGDLELTLAAYNAGEGAVQKYNGVPPYQETRAYVAKVQSTYNKLKDLE